MTGEVYILDHTFKALGLIDDAESVMWIERYYETGGVEIYAPATERNVSLLQRDRIAYMLSSACPAVIEDISIKETDAGVMILATGITADGMLDRRVFESMHTLKGTLGSVADSILEAYAFYPADVSRAFYDMEKGLDIEGKTITVPDDCRTFIEKARGYSSIKKHSTSLRFATNGDVLSLGEKNGDSVPYELEMHTNSGASQAISMSYRLRGLNESIYDELVLDHAAKQAYIIRRVGYKSLSLSDFNKVQSNMYYVDGIGYGYLYQYKLNSSLKDAQIGSMVLHQNIGAYDSSYAEAIYYSYSNLGTVDYPTGFHRTGPVLDDGTFFMQVSSTEVYDVPNQVLGDGYILYQLADEYTESVEWVDIPDYFNSYSMADAYLEGYYRVKTTADDNPFIKGDSLESSAEIDSQVTGDKVAEYLRELLREDGAGLRARLNDSRTKIILEAYRGSRRDYDQTDNPYIAFSSGNENLDSSEYTVKSSEEVNGVYVAGEGEGYLRTIYAVGTGSGWSRREAFVDARDLSSKLDEDTELTAEQYRTVLESRGKQSLKAANEALTGTVNLLVNYTYNEDFYLGDVVTIENVALGVYTNKRLIEIAQIWDATGYSIDPVFGD